MSESIEQVYELVPVAQLHPHPRNPRRGDVEAVMASITANGWHGAIVVQRSTGYVVAGNTRLRAARALGFDRLPVVWRDVDDATAERMLVADNRATDLGYFDADALAELLVSADDLAGMLYGEADLELLGIVLPSPPTLADADSPAEGAELPGEGRIPDDGSLGPATQDRASRANLAGVERAGGQVLVRETPAERVEDYQQAGVRSIVLPYGLEQYLAVTDCLRQVRQARGYSTNAEAVAALVGEAAAAL